MFEMGVPVSGKNLFPSNISGLPTWFIIRASDEGYQAPGDVTHIQVVMNKDTWLDDVEKAEPGTIIIHNMDVKLPVERDDCIVLGMPMTKMARSINPKLARMIANMYYVGALAETLGIEESAIASAVAQQFKGKEKAIELNLQHFEGRDFARENWNCDIGYSVTARDKDPNTFLIEGNEAAALDVFSVESTCYLGILLPLLHHLLNQSFLVPKLRQAEDGGATCAVIQAEDELAAAGMVVGAGWAGGRGMTCTSGPGISLMSEFIGLAYFAEVPGVIWDVNRVGPSTGLPTRTQQGDLTLLYEASHGDTQHIVLIPGTVDECFEFGWRLLT